MVVATKPVNHLTSKSWYSQPLCKTFTTDGMSRQSRTTYWNSQSCRCKTFQLATSCFWFLNNVPWTYIQLCDAAQSQSVRVCATVYTSHRATVYSFLMQASLSDSQCVKSHCWQRLPPSAFVRACGCARALTPPWDAENGLQNNSACRWDGVDLTESI